MTDDPFGHIPIAPISPMNISDPAKDRDDLLTALDFQPGPLGDGARHSVIINDLKLLRPERVKMQREITQLKTELKLLKTANAAMTSSLSQNMAYAVHSLERLSSHEAMTLSGWGFSHSEISARVTLSKLALTSLKRIIDE